MADGGKLYCVSYAPFRGAQDPLVEGTRVSAEQIDEDLAFLSHYTNCIRTYSVDDGRDDVLKSARRYGLKVLHGIWVSNDRDKTRRQIEATVALAKEYSDVITAVVVGNEVLLRGEMSPADLIGYIRDVKSRVSMPVTYADVWEFWLRYPDVQSAVDFVTVHILPYWEDFPIPASLAAAHVEAIHKKVADAFPNKEILIGEFGWPSAGRMREGARPSPSNQGRVIAETLAMAEREHFRVNVIEAFDQPWKRALEGVVGGYWGIFDRGTGKPKFGATVSDHPHWIGQAVAGIVLAALIFAAAWGAGRGKSDAAITLASDCGLSLPAGNSIRLDHRDGADRELWYRRLAAIAGLCRHRRRGADSLRGGLCRRPQAAELCRADVARRRAARWVGYHAWRELCGAHFAVGADGAWPGFRPALSRPAIRAAKRRRYCLPDPRGDRNAAARPARRGGDSRCGRAGAFGGLYRLQRNLRQLAGDLALCRSCRACLYSGAGAGRARLKIKSPAASADRSALCSTTPNPAATSVSVINRIDGPQ